MLLSVIIPTTASRFSIFKTIDSVHQNIRDFDFKIEVVVNRLRNNEKILEQLINDERIELRFHDKIHETAESSAMWAAYTSTSEWIWLLGDDDIATSGAIEHVKELIKIRDVSFWLLNVLLVFDHIPLEYYRVGPRSIQISTANKLWERCGFFSILTTISCFLLRRSSLDIKLFDEFHDTQGVYSHSFALLAMLKDSQVGATDYFCVVRNEENAENIEYSLSHYSKSRGIELNSIWTTGALKLFDLLSAKIDVPVSELVEYREIEIIKNQKNSYLRNSDLKILVSDSRSVIHRFDSAKSQSEYPLLSRNLIFTAPVRISL
jgi:hypothetical protein